MNDIIKPYTICFLGKTGNGKSSLINALFDLELPVDPLVSCTKELYAITKLTNSIHDYNAVTILDTPGIGEFSSNSIYQDYYHYAVSEADCVVLVLTMDRADASSQRLVQDVIPFIDKNKHVRFVVAVNHIDSKTTGADWSYEPWDMVNNIPTKECSIRIEERVKIIRQKFSDMFVEPLEIVPVCAVRKYGIDNLRSLIINK